MTILYLILKVAIALAALRYIGWPLAKILWRLIVQGWPFCKAAWGGVRRAFVARPLDFLLTMIAFAALGVAMAGYGNLPKLLFPPEADKTTWTNGAIYAGARMGVALLSAIILSPLLVSVHRVILGDRLQSGWFAAFRNFLCWMLALQVAVQLAINFSLLASAVGFVRNLLVLIAQISILIVAVGLALLPPDVAIGASARDAEARIDASWTAMTGRFWSTLGLFLLTMLPMLVLLFVLHRVGMPRPPNPPPIPLPPPAPPPVTKLLLIGRGLEGAAQAFAAAVAAAVASVLYARVKRD